MVVARKTTPKPKYRDTVANARIYVRNRIGAFVVLPLKSLDKLSLTAKLREIGTLEGASKPRPEVA